MTTTEAPPATATPTDAPTDAPAAAETPRADRVLLLTLAALDACLKFRDDPETVGKYASIDGRLLNVVRNCIDSWNRPPVPQELEELSPIIAVIQSEWGEFECVPNARRLHSRREFWQAIGRLNEMFNVTPDQTEWLPDYSVRDLMDGVYESGFKYTPRQVAAEYAWPPDNGPFMDDAGFAKADLILKEYNEPGSVLGPDFVHPRTLASRANATRHLTPLRIRADRLRAAATKAAESAK